MTPVLTLILAAAPAVIFLRLALGIFRVIRMGPAARRNYPRAVWARWRWRWLCRNLCPNLAYPDAHRRRAFHPRVFGTGARTRVVRNRRTELVRYPKAKFTADAWGITAKVKLIPGIGREQVEDVGPHISDAWHCHRVQVRQLKAGRLEVRGLRRDPLLEPYADTDAPPGAFGRTSVDNPLRLFVGIDAWAHPRWISLPGCTGITVAGLPGRGKSELMNSFLRQLDVLPARFVIIDGKSSHLPTSDYADWADRAWLMTGDDPVDAADVLAEAHQEMRRRFGSILELTGGKRNGWHVGPTEAMPLLLVIIDECTTLFDDRAARGDQRREKAVRACRSLSSELVRKGRSALVITATLTQKMTADSTDLSVRDNSGIAISFACKTPESAVGALGADIRNFPSLSPVQLQGDEYVGCCVTTLPSGGSDPYTMVRVPRLTTRWARDRERVPETAGA